VKGNGLMITIDPTRSTARVAEDLTGREREAIEEGLNYLEEHGAPGMRMRAGTKRMDEMLESISRKLHL
jgi:hypothetical protein